MIPDLLLSSGKSGSSSGNMDELMGILVYFIGVFFFSVNCVLKENILKDTSVDIFTLSFIDNTLAFTLTFLCIPLLFIPHVSLDTPATFLSHTVSGLHCFFSGEALSADRAVSELGGVGCDGVWLETVLFAISNVVLQSVMLFVLRISSSFTLNVLSTLQLPLSSLALSSPLMGSGRSHLTLASIVGMVGVSIGSGLYGFAELEGKREDAAIMGVAAEQLTEQRRLMVTTSAVGVTPAVTPRAAVRLDGGLGGGGGGGRRLRFDRPMRGEGVGGDDSSMRFGGGSRGHDTSAFIPLFADVPGGQDSVLYDSDNSLDDDDIR